MAKRKHITVILTILVAALLASGISGWLFLQSVQRVIGEAQQAGEYAAEAQQSVGQGDFKQALEQMDSAGSHIVAARDETQGMLWQAAEYVLLRFGREGGARHAGCGRRRRDQRPA